MTTKELIAALTGASILVVVVVFTIALVVLILEIIGRWFLYEKANKPGWASIIPYYNSYVLVEISGLNWWYFLLLIATQIIAILNIDNSGISLITGIAAIIGRLCVYYNLGKKLNKTPITIGILGIFFPSIMITIFGLSSNYKYNETVEVSKNGPFHDNKNNTNNEPVKYCLGCGNKLKPNTSFCENCGKKVE